MPTQLRRSPSDVDTLAGQVCTWLAAERPAEAHGWRVRWAEKRASGYAEGPKSVAGADAPDVRTVGAWLMSLPDDCGKVRAAWTEKADSGHRDLVRASFDMPPMEGAKEVTLSQDQGRGPLQVIDQTTSEERSLASQAQTIQALANALVRTNEGILDALKKAMDPDRAANMGRMVGRAEQYGESAGEVEELRAKVARLEAAAAANPLWSALAGAAGRLVEKKGEVVVDMVFTALAAANAEKEKV
jgi:hypothetical protein